MLLGGFEFVLKPRVICYVSYDKTHTAEVKGCNTHKCHETRYCQWDQWSSWADCTIRPKVERKLWLKRVFSLFLFILFFTPDSVFKNIILYLHGLGLI